MSISPTTIVLCHVTAFILFGLGCIIWHRFVNKNKLTLEDLKIMFLDSFLVGVFFIVFIPLMPLFFALLYTDWKADKLHHTEKEEGLEKS